MNTLRNKPRETRHCEHHGDYESVNYLGTVWSQCPECSKNESAEKSKQEAIETAEDKRRRWESRLAHSCIPPRFRDRTLGNYVASNDAQRNALKFCQDYAHNFDEIKRSGKSIIFCGRPGTGKTHLAIGIATEVMKNNKANVLFITVMKAIRRIKNTWSNDAEETEGQVINLLASPDLLILDEIGVQYGSDTEENFIFEIINERYQNRLPTILISNLDIDGVRKYLGDRVFDRLREDDGKLIPFTWDSYRKNHGVGQ